MVDEKKSVSEIRVQDPLSLVTRRERRNLLLVSTIGLIMHYTGLVPSKFNALGIEFTTAEKQWFFIIVALITLYFTITFISYAASDFVAWRISFNSTRLYHFEKDLSFITPTDERERIQGLEVKLLQWTKVSLPISVFRVFIEFVFPILLSLYTIFTLI